MGLVYNFALTLSTEGRRALRQREGLRGYYEVSRPGMTPDQVEAAFDLSVRSAERAVQRHRRQLEALGYRVTIEKAA